MSGIIKKLGIVVLGIVGIGCLVDSLAQRTAERIIDKLGDQSSMTKRYDDLLNDEPLEPDNII